MIDRLKPVLKVTAASGLAALGLTGAGVALADDGDERRAFIRSSEYTNDGERRAFYVTTSDESGDGSDGRLFYQFPINQSDDDESRMLGKVSFSDDERIPVPRPTVPVEPPPVMDNERLVPRVPPFV